MMKKKYFSILSLFIVSLMVVVSVIPTFAEETDGKYKITSDATGELVGTYDQIVDATVAIQYLPKGNYTMTLYEDDLDMGLWGGISAGYQITLTSSEDGPFTIYNRRESNNVNSQFHFSQVSGNLILENITLDGGNVGGGIIVSTTYEDTPASLTLNEGAIIQNCVDILNPGGAIRTVGPNTTITINGGIIRDNTATRNGGGIAITSGNTLIMNSGLITGNKTSASGGGILSDGTFIMNGGEISHNSANSQFGGGIALTPKGHFELIGGSITNNSAKSGGGIYVEGSASGKSYKIDKLINENNVATEYGGGIFTANALDISNSTFDTNSAGMYGGGIAAYAPVTVEGSSFDNNSANSGGGIFSTRPSTVSNTTFNSNTSEATGGGIAAYAPITVENSAFESNSSIEGGGLYTRYAASDISSVDNVSFVNNNATFGGGIENWNATLEINDSAFIGNTATSNGGAAYVFNLGKLNIGNSVFVNNFAEKMGGAIYTLDLDYSDPVDSTKYQNIILDDQNYFNQNTAGQGLYQSPSNAFDLTNLKFNYTSVSSSTTLNSPHILNNYDINYSNDEPISLHTLTYDANGGVGSYTESIASNATASVKSHTDVEISREHYDFVEWNTKQDGSGTAYSV